MAQIIVEIPDEKIPLIQAWVASRMSGTSDWVSSDFVDYVDSYITGNFKATIYKFQQAQYLQTFTFDDPTTSG